MLYFLQARAVEGISNHFPVSMFFISEEKIIFIKNVTVSALFFWVHLSVSLGDGGRGPGIWGSGFGGRCQWAGRRRPSLPPCGPPEPQRVTASGASVCQTSLPTSLRSLSVRSAWCQWSFVSVFLSSAFSTFFCPRKGQGVESQQNSIS